MSFSNLKKNRGASIAKLVEAANKLNTSGSNVDPNEEKLWKPVVDKAGNGYAVIRFLPALDGQDLPWVRYWDHGFKGPAGQWYIENSLTSIGQEDPVGKINSALWNSGVDSDKEIARDRKRRLHYVANIYVVSDPSNPDNEGKVFMFKFGKKIFDKIMDVMQPQFEDEDAVDPFDLWEGANFKLKIRNVEGYRNYDKSEFDKPKALLDDEAKLEAVYNSMHDIGYFVDPANYKSYAELESRLKRVIGSNADVLLNTTAESVDLDETAPSKMDVEKTKPWTETTEGEDDTMAYFQKLASDD